VDLPVANDDLKRLELRVVSAAEAALVESQVVSLVDVFERIGWLPRGRVQEWQQGRIPYLEAGISTNPRRISEAMQMFDEWARLRELTPMETEYVSRTRDRRPLRFTETGQSAIEQAYRTRWTPPEVSAGKRQRLQKELSRPPELVVISPIHDWTCASCQQEGGGRFLLMQEGGPVCLACAGLGHLVFVPAGDALLTRRAKKASSLSAVVVRFSRARKRYERQGILVEESALEAASRSAP
jgi:hypothetical protein